MCGCFQSFGDTSELSPELLLTNLSLVPCNSVIANVYNNQYIAVQYKIIKLIYFPANYVARNIWLTCLATLGEKKSFPN